LITVLKEAIVDNLPLAVKRGKGAWVVDI
jgi:hypothetical protein